VIRNPILHHMACPGTFSYRIKRIKSERSCRKGATLKGKAIGWNKRGMVEVDYYMREAKWLLRRDFDRGEVDLQSRQPNAEKWE